MVGNGLKGAGALLAGAALAMPLAAQQTQGEDTAAASPPPIRVLPAFPSSPPSPGQNVRTKNEWEWARQIQENYPTQALLSELQGTVGVRVSVNDIGRVAQCLVTSSSGHAILDEAACSGMVRFATFDPALDAEGKPTFGSYATRITYRMTVSTPPPGPRGPATKNEMLWATLIQQNYPALALREELQGKVSVRVEVNTQGRVDRCFITGSSGHDVLDTAACKGMLRFATFHPALDAEANEIAGTYSTRISYIINNGTIAEPIPLEGEGREVTL